MRCLGLIIWLGCVGSASSLAQELEETDPVWTYSHPGGLVTEAFDLNVTLDQPEAVIHFTTDGSSPTAESPVWMGSLVVKASSMVRFAAVLENALLARSGAAYLFVERDVAAFSSNLPIVVVDSFGVNVDRNDQHNSRAPKRPVWAVFLKPGDETGRTEVLSAPDFSGRAGMRVRGQTSTMFPKKQYSLELWDEEDDDASETVLGFPKESDWILHAPFSDKTLMRNVLAYQWFREMGHYAVGTEYVELFYNKRGDAISMDDYAGVYVFMEKIKRDKARLPLAKLTEEMATEPEISGGYIFKKDKGTREDVHFRTRDWHQYGFVEPDEPNEAQFDYLMTYVSDFENALYRRNFADPEKGYASYIDVGSFIDVHIHVELCRNIDGFRLSTYYHKDREGKIVMGPVWDYNLSLGNTTMRGGQYPEGWYHDTISNDDYTYFSRLFEDPAFELRHWDRYYQLRETVLETSKIMRQIDAIADKLEEAQERNFRRWRILGDYQWQNPRGAEHRDSHRKEVAWLKDWLKERLAWFDEQFVAPPHVKVPEFPLAPGSPVTLKGRRGTQVYYTLDGTDPWLERASGTFVQSGGAVPVKASATLKARAVEGGRWGALTEVALHVDGNLPPASPRRPRSPWFGVVWGALALLLFGLVRRALRRAKSS